jgi:hypothetical protein
LIRQALYKRGVYWHVFPTYREAKNAVWRDPNMLFNILPPRAIKKRNDSELVIETVNGSIIQLIGADNPETHLGSGPRGAILDEFEEMKIEMWERILEPILRANDGWCWFIGTPKGKNHLFETYQKGLYPNAEWKSWMLKADKSGIFTPDQLANAKISMRDALFNQEMMCEFLEGEGSVFRGVREVMTSTPQKPNSKHLYVMGVDLAKIKDYTVITVYDRETNRQVYQNRFNQIEWPYQKARIFEIAKHYNNALVVLDATGLGDPIADDLIRVGLSVEPIKLTSESKKDLIEKLSIWIEQGKIEMLPLQETAFEFDNYSYEIGPTGKIRYQAIEGFNDDIVISHALAVYKLQPLIIIKPNPNINLVQLAYRQAKKDYETEDQWSEYGAE